MQTACEVVISIVFVFAVIKIRSFINKLKRSNIFPSETLIIILVICEVISSITRIGVTYTVIVLTHQGLDDPADYDQRLLWAQIFMFIFLNISFSVGTICTLILMMRFGGGRQEKQSEDDIALKREFKLMFSAQSINQEQLATLMESETQRHDSDYSNDRDTTLKEQSMLIDSLSPKSVGGPKDAEELRQMRYSNHVNKMLDKYMNQVIDTAMSMSVADPSSTRQSKVTPVVNTEYNTEDEIV